MEYWRYRLLKPPISLNMLFYSLPAADSQNQQMRTGPTIRTAQSIALLFQQSLNFNKPSKSSFRPCQPIRLARSPDDAGSNRNRPTITSAHTLKTIFPTRLMANSYNTERINTGAQGLNQKHHPSNAAVKRKQLLSNSHFDRQATALFETTYSNYLQNFKTRNNQ
ncbi:MAG: hypothetical protein ABW119_15505 [Candidatus Thiodiazotropha lotti]